MSESQISSPVLSLADGSNTFVPFSFISKGVGAIIGECGTVNKNNLSSRIAWAKYFPVVFGDNGIPVFLWDNNAFGVGTEKFGQLHRNTLTWEYPEYIKALVNAAKSCK